MAVNTVIQGTAAEVLKKVMVKVYDVLKDKEDIALLLQVHDELIFEVEKSSVEKYSEILADIMKNTVQLEDVKLNININIGKNWAEAKQVVIFRMLHTKIRELHSRFQDKN